MGEWVETEYGLRYKEDYGSCVAYFLTEPDENGKRAMPDEVMAIIIEAKLRQLTEQEDSDL